MGCFGVANRATHHIVMTVVINFVLSFDNVYIGFLLPSFIAPLCRIFVLFVVACIDYLWGSCANQMFTGNCTANMWMKLIEMECGVITAMFI
jgi:hypothetical protein